jgi:2-polyprenyl-6-hydroxyphenyl methylase / 3-demethylubiquinone-9 3-methyltransferase
LAVIVPYIMPDWMAGAALLWVLGVGFLIGVALFVALLAYTWWRWSSELSRGPIDRRLPIGTPYREIVEQCSADATASAVALADSNTTNIDNAIYDTHAAMWWDESSPFSAGLHAMTRARAPYFSEVFAKTRGWTPSRGLADESGPVRTQKSREGVPVVRVLDVGCGGGILAEALAVELLARARGSLGDCGPVRVEVTGVDLAPGAILEARRHVDQAKLPDEISLSYIVGDARALTNVVERNSADILVVADVLEHITDLPQVLREASAVLSPGGVMVFDTLNRTFLSMFLGIVCAQEVPIFRFLPEHAHEWNLFLTPKELGDLCADVGLCVEEVHGFRPVANFAFVRGLLQRSHTSKIDFCRDKNTAAQFIGFATKSVKQD